MILAAFFLAVVLNGDECESLSEPEVIEIPEVTEVIVRHAMMPSKPAVVSNMDGLTFAQYETMIPTFPPAPSVSLAEEFMYTTLFQPNVIQMTMGDFQTAILPVGAVVSHMWRNETADSFIRYGSITTPYGNIYVTCALDENGALADKDTPLQLCFDNTALPSLLNVAASQNPHRFPAGYVYHANAIRSVYDLAFLFGNGVDVDNVTQYLTV